MTSPPLRSLADRARQVLLFELIGLIVITPGFALVSGQPLADSGLLLLVLSLIATAWNGVYGTSFDWIEGRLTGRTADLRPPLLRLGHAAGFEGGLLLLTLPVIVWMTGLDWWSALLADIGLALCYTVYAYVFNLLYDKRFPITGGN